MNRRIEEVISLKLKYIVKISLVCGVMSTAVALSGCGSSKAVQANAAVMSRSSDASNSSMSTDSSGVTVSSDLVSHSTPSVSSAVVTSKSTGSNSTSHQAPATKSNSGGVTRTTSAAPKPASTKPASRPASTAPTPRPTSTAPVSQGISAKYHGATYGCDDRSQYNYVLSHADVVGSSQYNKTYNYDTANPDGFEKYYGVPYTEAWRQIVAIRSYFGTAGTGSGSSGSAYDYFTGSNRMCADKAKALEAALHLAGYNARLAGGTENGVSHMWVQVYEGGWYNLDGHISTSLNAGYSLSSTGYNL